MHLRFVFSANLKGFRSERGLSQSDLALTFGLGKDSTVSALEIDWPSGGKQRLTNIAANQFITIEEGKGITATSSPRATH